jgi:hypothetical protein
MRTGPLSLFRRALKKAPPVHPVEGGLAKQWIKRRLLKCFPHLRNQPEALEAAYQELDLEPRRGSQPGDPHTYFEMRRPEE